MAVLLGMITYQAVLLHNNPRGAILVRPDPKWKPGVALASIKGEMLGGPRQTVDLSVGETVIYVFSPACAFCTRNIDNARSLHQAQGSKFISISTTDVGLESYIKKHQIKYPVYLRVSDLGTTGTPATLTVKNGVIDQYWFGWWVDDTKSKLEKYFGLILPGSN